MTMKILQPVLPGRDLDGLSVRCFPDSALLKGGKPVFLPYENHEYRLSAGVALIIGKLGKGFAPGFADRYVDHIVPVAVFEDIDMARSQREKHLDPSMAWMFDGAVNMGREVSKQALGKEIIIRLAPIRSGSEAVPEMRFCAERHMPDWKDVLSAMAQTMTFKTGDMIIMAEEYSGVIAPETHLTAHVDAFLINENSNNKHHDTILDFNIK